MSEATWKPSLQAFFDTRADEIAGTPTLRELCFIAGREPRLWSDREVYRDLIDSIVGICAIDRRSSVLEVGCAAGFIAFGVAPQAKSYHGVDLAPATIKVARRLRLPNARFSIGDGSRLDFRSESFDAVFCYDVFTNLPNFAFGASLIREMIRVVRPGGKVLVGSVPDGAVRGEFEAYVPRVQQLLDERYGPIGPDPARKPPGLLRRLVRRVAQPRAEAAPAPGIVCYYFDRKDFVDLGRELGTSVSITGIHSKNPYASYRFNAVYTKP